MQTYPFVLQAPGNKADTVPCECLLISCTAIFVADGDDPVAWEKVKGLEGRVFVPDKTPDRKKKHPCNGCHACQVCSDDRCRVCRPDISPLKKTTAVCRKTPCACDRNP